MKLSKLVAEVRNTASHTRVLPKAFGVHDISEIVALYFRGVPPHAMGMLMGADVYQYVWTADTFANYLDRDGSAYVGNPNGVMFGMSLRLVTALAPGEAYLYYCDTPGQPTKSVHLVP